ncbi:MAG: DUF1553 domain-containing protein [Pirellulaceae bacterium]
MDVGTKKPDRRLAHATGTPSASSTLCLPKQLVYVAPTTSRRDGSFRPSVEPGEVQVLRRGLVPALIEPAGSWCDRLSRIQGLLVTEEAATDEAARRVALARWLVADGQPLSWARDGEPIWLQHFGSGIVTTPNDFGRMGCRPGHPWVLDHLASSSAIWNDQASPPAAAAELDLPTKVPKATMPTRRLMGPGGVRWGAMPRRRLDAESVRDGLPQNQRLARFPHGRSIGPTVCRVARHPCHAGGRRISPLTDPAFHRRSVYRFIFRTVPDPFFDSLDCPDASQWTPQPQHFTHRVQALATLHDRQDARGGATGDSLGTRGRERTGSRVAIVRAVIARAQSMRKSIWSLVSLPNTAGPPLACI